MVIDYKEAFEELENDQIQIIDDIEQEEDKNEKLEAGFPQLGKEISNIENKPETTTPVSIKFDELENDDIYDDVKVGQFDEVDEEVKEFDQVKITVPDLNFDNL